MKYKVFLLKNAGGYLEYRYGPAGTVELLNIQIKKNKQRLGYGTDLVNKLETEIIKTGDQKTIYLFTRYENKIAHRFYKKYNFIESGRLKKFYKDNFGKFSGDCLIFLKSLHRNRVNFN